ncbi:MAG TPA: hypothetical protein VN754_11060 [Candidatus Binataceae bacterium]|nr:hypothetical protein [Candidatus Binataceae bacterium]
MVINPPCALCCERRIDLLEVGRAAVPAIPDVRPPPLEPLCRV